MSSPNRPTIPFAPTLEVPGADMHLRLASVGSAEEFAAMCYAGGEALARFVPQLAKAAIDNERSEGGLRRLDFQVTGESFVDEEDFRATGVKQTVRMWSRPV